MKLKSFIAAFLLVQVIFQPVFVAEAEIGNLSELFERVEAIEVIFVDEGLEGTFSFSVIGSETINSSTTWKVETVFGESGEEESYTVWVDKVTGRTVKALVNNEEITGMFAEVYGNLTLGFFMGFVYNYWETWKYEDFIELGQTEMGTLTHLGKEEKTYGPTTLEIYGIKYEGKITQNETLNYLVETWVAPTQFGGITTKISLTATGDEGINVELELSSITLMEPQQVPDEFIDLIELQPEPETEIEQEQEPDTELEPEQKEKTGGIPGFSNISVLVGVVILTLLLLNKRSQVFSQA